MLDFKIDGKDVAIYKDSEMVINLNNPNIRSREDNTYPLTLPLDVNRKSLGYIDRFTVNDIENKSAQVSFGGMNLLKGETVMTDVNDNEVETFISTSKIAFWSKYKGVWLDRTDLGRQTDVVVYDEMNKAFADKSLPYMGTVVKLFEGEDFKGNINAFDSSKSKFVYGKDYIPFFRLKVVIELLFQKENLTINDNSTHFADLADVLIFNTHCINIMRVGGREVHFNNHLPHVDVAEWLHDVENKFSLVFMVDNKNKVVEIIDKLNYNNTENIHVEVYDNLSKAISEEEKTTTSENIVYSDSIEVTEDISKYIIGNAEAEDAKTINFISSTLQVTADTTQVGVGSGQMIDATYHNIHKEYPLIEEKDDVIYFLSKGLQKVSAADQYQEHLVEPLSWNGDNGLYNLYHKDIASLQNSINYKVECELYLTPSLKLLFDSANFFKSKVIARGQIFIIASQEIVLSNDSIKSHKLIGLPCKSVL